MKVLMQSCDMCERVCRPPQDLVLQLLQFPLARGDVDHQRVLLFLQLRTLLPHHDPQQLGLQTLMHTELCFILKDLCHGNKFINTHTDLFFNSKVDDGGFGRDFRSVMWIGQFGGHVETEFRTVFHFFISQF